MNDGSELFVMHIDILLNPVIIFTLFCFFNVASLFQLQTGNKCSFSTMTTATCFPSEAAGFQNRHSKNCVNKNTVKNKPMLSFSVGEHVLENCAAGHQRAE